jgi:hypothetical protein
MPLAIDSREKLMTKNAWIVAAAFLALACGGEQAASQTAASAAGGGKNPIGGGCASDGDCVSGLFCEKGDPGGQCLKKCASTADCGPGAVCSDEKKCYAACKSAADCTRKGYTCKGKAPEMFCDTAEEAEEHEKH